MTDHRARYGPHNPDETYVAHAIAEQLVDLGEIEMNYATVGDAVVAGAAAHPGPDRVVVGLRGGDAAARRALPGVRRRSPGPGPQHAHARPLHARQHGQRPGPLHRPRDRATDDRERPVLGRRPRRLAVGVRQARSGASRRSTRTRRCSRRRSGRPSVPASASASARCSTSGAPSSATSGRSAPGTRCARDRAARLPEHLRFIPVPDEPPQNLKEYDPEWGRSFWTGTVAAVVRPRADAAQRQGARGAAHAPHAHHRRGQRLPVRCDVRPAGPAGAGPPHRRGRRRASTGRSPTSATRCTATGPSSTSRPSSTGSRASRRERVPHDRRARPLPPGELPGGAAGQRPRPTRRLPPDPGLVRRGARCRDGPARDRDVAAVDLVTRRAPRRRTQRLGTSPAR